VLKLSLGVPVWGVDWLASQSIVAAGMAVALGASPRNKVLAVGGTRRRDADVAGQIGNRPPKKIRTS